MKRKNNVGRNSLIVSIAGLAVIEILFYNGVIEGDFWRIIEIGFEAATVGGLADWFAVSALFREIPVPIPFIKKHTNIIVNNRKKLTDGASELVTGKWLSKESLQEKISGFDFSGFILENLNDPNPKYKENIIDLIRDAALRFVSVIDRPDILEFLKKIFNDQIKDLEMAKPLGNWIRKSFNEGKHEQLWEMLIRNTRNVINNDTTRNVLEKQIEKLVQSYKDEGFTKKIFVSIAEYSKGLDRKIIADKLIEVTNDFLDEAEKNPGHKFRKDLDKVILDFADGLINNEPSSVKVITDLKGNILNNPDVEILLHNALSNLKKTVTAQLENNNTPLMKALIDNFERIINDINDSKESQKKINSWIKVNLSEMIDKHHHKIGEHVIESMNKLDDKELVQQIEEKVGDDLQFIRLNGAIVGGLAGIMIGLVKFFLD